MPRVPRLSRASRSPSFQIKKTSSLSGFVVVSVCLSAACPSVIIVCLSALHRPSAICLISLLCLPVCLPACYSHSYSPSCNYTALPATAHPSHLQEGCHRCERCCRNVIRSSDISLVLTKPAHTTSKLTHTPSMPVSRPPPPTHTPTCAATLTCSAPLPSQAAPTPPSCSASTPNLMHRHSNLRRAPLSLIRGKPLAGPVCPLAPYTTAHHGHLATPHATPRTHAHAHAHDMYMCKRVSLSSQQVPLCPLSASCSAGRTEHTLHKTLGTTRPSRRISRLTHPRHTHATLRSQRGQAPVSTEFTRNPSRTQMRVFFSFLLLLFGHAAGFGILCPI